MNTFLGAYFAPENLLLNSIQCQALSPHYQHQRWQHKQISCGFGQLYRSHLIQYFTEKG